MARIIAIANQKGGVGKSTTAVSLGAALADLGFRVLVVDLDPQGNASTGLGVRHERREITVYDVIVADSPVDRAVVETPVRRLHAVPSTIDLAGAEIELVSQFSREMRLKKALEPLREGFYDFILLDCPPSLGLLTINALTAAEELIVPIQCEYYALEGLGQLLRNVSLVQQNINHGLRLSGIVMTMFDPRTKLSEQVVAEVQKYFGDLVYDVIIPRTVRLSEAPGFGQPITMYDPKSKGAETYRELAREVALRPPPAEPMPAFDDLPARIVPQVDIVTRNAPEDVGEEDVISLTEVEAAPAPEPEREVEVVLGEEVDRPAAASTTPASGDTAAATQPEAEGEPSVDRPIGAARPAAPPGRPAPTLYDVEEEARAKAASSSAASRRGGQHAAGRKPRPAAASARPAEPGAARPLEPGAARPPEPEAARPPGPETARRPAPTEATRPDAPAPERGSVPAPPAPDRKVVVIDEDAEMRRASAGPEPMPLQPGGGEDPNIGATLEEEAPRRRRWRLFRKGGE